MKTTNTQIVLFFLFVVSITVISFNPKTTELWIMILRQVSFMYIGGLCGVAISSFEKYHD